MKIINLNSRSRVTIDYDDGSTEMFSGRALIAVLQYRVRYKLFGRFQREKWVDVERFRNENLSLDFSDELMVRGVLGFRRIELEILREKRRLVSSVKEYMERGPVG